jgi:hypothetical protein
MIKRIGLKVFRYLSLAAMSLIAVLLMLIGLANYWESAKYGEVVTINASYVVWGCGEGCNYHIVDSVNSKKFSWLVGKWINVHVDEKQFDQNYFDSDYTVYCMSGQLHKHTELPFLTGESDIYGFTVSGIRAGMCSNPKAKIFKE